MKFIETTKSLCKGRYRGLIKVIRIHGDQMKQIIRRVCEWSNQIMLSLIVNKNIFFSVNV